MNIKKFFFTNQSGAQIVAKNTVWLFIGEIGGRLARFALIVFAAHILGARQWGLFTYALSIASVFTFVSDWGFNALITRSLSQQQTIESRETVSTIIYLKTILSFLALILTIFIGTKISTVHDANYLIYITAGIVFFDGLRDFMVSINRATEKMEREALVKVSTNLIIFFVGIIGLSLIPQIRIMAIAYIIGSGVGLLIAGYFVRKIIITNVGVFSFKSSKTIFLIAWPFTLLSATIVILSNMDMLALGRWSSIESIGIYASAQRTVQLFHIIPSFFSFALFPQLSRIVNTDTKRFHEMVNFATMSIFLAVFPLIIIGIVIAKPGLSFLFGAIYGTGAAAFSILLCSLPFVFLHIVFSNVLIAQNRQRSILTANILGVATGIAAIIILVPRYSIIGAALGMVVANATIAITLWIVIRKDISFLNTFKKLQKVFLSSILMIVTAFYIQKILHNFFITIAVSLAIYIGILLVTKEKTAQKVLKTFYGF